MSMPYQLGCPAWSIADWKGNFLPANARSSEFLELYSRVFNTVEGNTTFYALPRLETAQRWAEQVPAGFKFCFKIPRDISHGMGLMGRPELLEEFTTFLEPFAESETLGPVFLQLSHNFGPARLVEAEQFFTAWPRDLPLAVEVRHSSFFDDSDHEQRLTETLSGRSIDRIIFDSRALYHAPAEDPAEAVSQTRKPNLPVRWRATGKRPFVRFVGRNTPEQADPWLEELAPAIAEWIGQGLHPYVFIHAPDDTFAPPLAERFHRCLRSRLPSLPELDLRAAHSDQLELF